MDQRVIDLYDAYTHGGMDRRGFLARLAGLAGGSAAAAAALALLQNRPAHAGLVGEADPRLTTGLVSFGPPDAPVSGYLARTRGEGKRPAVLVIHENRGLNAHIRDVTRRFALEGFLALAPDMLSSRGGTPADEDAARAMIRELDAAQVVAGLAAAAAFLVGHPESTGKVGAVGFCWGGGMANRLAAAAAPIAAAVAYYGSQLPAEEVPKLHAPLLLHYAGLDERINAGIEPFVAALEAHGKSFEMHMYEDAQHAFNNDASPARYNRTAAELAWSRTLAFLRRHLSS